MNDFLKTVHNKEQLKHLKNYILTGFKIRKSHFKTWNEIKIIKGVHRFHMSPSPCLKWKPKISLVSMDRNVLILLNSMKQKCKQHSRAWKI